MSNTNYEWYWRLPWPARDTIILPCGHERGVMVSDLLDPNVAFPCPYTQWDMCDQEPYPAL